MNKLAQVFKRTIFHFGSYLFYIQYDFSRLSVLVFAFTIKGIQVFAVS